MSTTEGPPLLPGAESKKELLDQRVRPRAPRAAAGSAGWDSAGMRCRGKSNGLYLIIIVVLAYLLPVVNPPFITTEPGNNWQIACCAHVHLRAGGGRPERRGRIRRPAGPGVCGLLRRRLLYRGHADQPGLPLLHIPYLWTLPVAMAVAMFFGVVLGIPTLRLRGDYLAIVTLGFGEIVRILATIIPAMKGQVGFQNVGHPPGTDSTGTPIFLELQRYALVLADADGHHHRPAAGRATWSAAAWAGPGLPSARTRTPRRSWACPPSSTRSGRSSSAPRSVGSPARCSPARSAS